MTAHIARPWRRFFLILITLIIWVAVPTVNAAAQTSTFAPVADAYVHSDKPTKSFGTSTELRADASPIENTYLRFNVQGLQGPISRATLRLFATTVGNARGVDLRGLADSMWAETTLTYNNAPAPSGTIAAHIGAYSANVPISLDASTLVRGTGVVSMVVTTTATTVRTFSSREASANPPQLIVETADGTAPVVDVAVPAYGASVNTAAPTFNGSAGTLPGDSSTISVKVFAGSAATGLPIQSLTTTEAGGTWSVTPLTQLVDGTYTVEAEQADTDGNVGTSTPHTFTVDGTPPAVVLDPIGSGGWSNDTTPDLTGAAETAAGDAATVRVRIYAGRSPSGTPLQTLTAPVADEGTWTATASALAAGTYTVQAEQSDAAGSVGVSQARALAVDTTAPSPSLTDPPSGSTTKDPTPLVRGTAGTAPGDSDVIAIAVYTGSTMSGAPVASFSTTQSAGDWSAEVPGTLDEGTYTVRARQSDAAGNIGTTAAHAFQVAPDAGPVVTLTRPLDGSSVATTTPLFRGSGATSAGDAGTVTVNVFPGTSVSGIAVQSLTAHVGFDGTWSVTASNALSEGAYTAQASQPDDSGHTGTSAAAKFNVDVTGPDTVIDSEPSDPIRSATATFTFHATDADARYECSVDGAAYAGCTSGMSLTGLSDGQHTFAVSAVDDAGNTDPTPASREWSVDTATPEVTLTNPPAATSSTNASPTFSGGAGTAAGDSDTVTLKVYAGTGTSGAVAGSLSTMQAGGSWSAAISSRLPEGSYTAQAEQRDSAGNTGRSSPVPINIDAAVIAAAGDVACDPLNTSFKGGDGGSSSCHQKATSDLLVNQDLAAVLGLGDLQYACSGYDALLHSYDLSWGRVKPITFPVVGNHEYDTSGGTDCDSTGNATGFFRYWGTQAGYPAKGYYSFDIGTWHLIALNSNASCQIVACNAGSAQEQWLKADLAAHPNACTLAYWHTPRFSSGGGGTSTSQLWKDLYAAGADVVLNGHVHNYERFVPQDPSGNPDAARGIREFVVGTGGASHGSFSTFLATSEVHDNTAYGVLKLTLHADGYDWRFVPEATKNFTDEGSGTCH